MPKNWTLFSHLRHIKTSGTCQNWKCNKLKIQKNKSFVHGYTKYLRWANNSQAEENIDEKQGGLIIVFYDRRELFKSYRHSKTVSLAEQWTYFNKKYLRGNNFPHFKEKNSGNFCEFNCLEYILLITSVVKLLVQWNGQTYCLLNTHIKKDLRLASLVIVSVRYWMNWIKTYWMNIEVLNK